jgi:NAD(P)-dependent dehydrogenase (short-subunit alcohol dehydrogenase family)
VRVRRFEGRTALVTGGASGIGEATVRAFVEEGARVVVADIDTHSGQRLIEELGSDAIAFESVDVRERLQVEEAIRKTVERFGRLDILCNNAAFLHGTLPLTETTEETWDRTLDTNLKGVYHCCKAGIPAMLATGSGVIVNTASVLGVVAQPRYASYIASKGGLVQLTRSIALDYAPTIRANAVCPGSIESPPVASALQERPELRHQVSQKIPLGRLGRCDEVASAILFLASDEASYVTGSLLIVDGGWTAS